MGGHEDTPSQRTWGQQPKQKCREQIWATVVISEGLEARVEGAVERDQPGEQAKVMV